MINSKFKKQLFLLVIVSFVLLGYSLSDKSEKEQVISMPVFIDRVIDGDTFQANGSSFRLLGINTPEKGENFYDEAKSYLMSYDGNYTIFDFYGVDKYGRNLGYLHFGEVLVNEELVLLGLASSYYYQDDKYKHVILRSELLAKNKGLGIWSRSSHVCSSCFIIGEINSGIGGKGEEDCKAGGELLKFYNNCSFSCDISSWFVKDSATHKFAFPKVVVEEKETVTLFNGKGENDLEKKVFYFNNKPIGSCYSLWNDDGDSIFLRDEKGLLVDFRRY
ncbi:MAG: thermonuclease family protein [Nanoarchaeota archaeon]